ncbi:dentin sialophosphoprotein-related [Forsythia ovata]|uniref:Dentin sialophosphoprotein-related n=1 Tax=Forsythia ovata TaxID=205694 RepID=A0ABD1VI87_9LAMI
MSDLRMFEFEDIVWDDFCQSDDHIVPHPSDEQDDENTFRDGKRPRLEVTGISRNSGDRSATRNIGQEKDHGDFSNLSNQRSSMLEKDSLSLTPNVVFPSSSDRDSFKEVSSLASENAKTPGHGFKSNNTDTSGSEFGVDDPVLKDKSTVVDGNSYSYTLGNISQTDNDLNFFDNNPEDKDSSDFLYYGWPEIGNFEDVDRIFRNCESTFALGAGKEDELGWFSSPDAVQGSEDVPKSDFKFSCSHSNVLENISEKHDSSMQNASYSVNDSALKSGAIRYKGSSWPSEIDESVKHLAFVNGPSSLDSKDKLMPRGQVNEHKKQSKYQNQSGGKRKEHYYENGSSFNYINNPPNEVMQLDSGATSNRNFTYTGVRQQQQALGPDSSGHLRNTVPFVHSDNSLISDQTSAHPTLSAIKSENHDLTSLSQRKSSYASSQVQSVENPHDPSSVSVETQVRLSGDKFENHSDAGVSVVIPGELGSSNVPEGSSMSSGLDDISQEAANFRHLQLVMEQLDLRTKLCIRDSLYRLARSAEQRNNHANPTNGCGDDRDASGALMAEGTNKCAEFMDMETDTNPIDRSVAHLLFHRPSDSSVKPAHDSLLLDKSKFKTHEFLQK